MEWRGFDSLPTARWEFGRRQGGGSRLPIHLRRPKLPSDLLTQKARHERPQPGVATSPQALGAVDHVKLAIGALEVVVHDHIVVVDPTGDLAKEVAADNNLGLKLGLSETPTIIVTTPKGWIQVKDVSDLYQAIDEAEAMVASTPAAAHHTVAHK